MKKTEKPEDVVYGPPAPEPEALYPRHTLLLPPNVAALAKLAGENPRYALAAVHVCSTQRGYRVEATNGKVLGVVSAEQEPNDVAEYPEIPGLAAAPNSATEVLLPPKTFAEAFKSVPRRFGKPVLGNVAAVLGEQVATLATTDLEKSVVLQSRLVEGRYPDFTQVMPKGQPKVKLSVDPKLLIELLKLAAGFDGLNDGKRVELEIYAPDKPVVVKARGQSQEFTGLIVPLS